ncbi:MAG: DUF4143 domain-containing protein [Clostridia bacterium]|nr:DUF4143 domain-containing protein [Clostridia bacterium]
MEKYYPRIADKLIKDTLRRSGGVLVEGPRWCGKTTTAEQLAGSSFYLDPEFVGNYRDLLSIAPENIFGGETPRLIDEWQLLPMIWDKIKREIDVRNDVGQFILTGSSVPADLSQIAHSGIGRIVKLRMGTMSLFESGESQGTVSLEELFSAPEAIHGAKKITPRQLAFLICRGGWPFSLRLEKEDDAIGVSRDYYYSLTKEDVYRVDGTRKNPSTLEKIMRSYAKNICTQIKYSRICEDIRLTESSSTSEDTVCSYIAFLKRLFVIDEIPAWQPNILSNIYVRTTETRNFVDPSIATAALNLTPDILLRDITMFGKLFESLCLRDLGAYAEYLGGELYHYKDSKNLECDAVIQLKDGRWGAVEIKLGIYHTNEGAANLKKLYNKVDKSKMMPPSFLMVLSGSEEFAYRRRDGVYVVPIDCLKY